MSAARKARKPTDPMAIPRDRTRAGGDPDTWGVNLEAQSLPANGHVLVRRQDRQIYAARQDVFERLAGRGQLNEAEHRAVRQLEELLTIRRGEGGGRDLSPDLIDCAGNSAERVTERMLDAGRQVRAMLGRIGPRSGRLLVALLEHDRDSAPHRWREIALRITGESNDRAQAALVRGACADLAEAAKG